VLHVSTVLLFIGHPTALVNIVIVVTIFTILLMGNMSATGFCDGTVASNSQVRASFTLSFAMQEMKA
jgi:hypothetical protein